MKRRIGLVFALILALATVAALTACAGENKQSEASGSATSLDASDSKLETGEYQGALAMAQKGQLTVSGDNGNMEFATDGDTVYKLGDADEAELEYPSDIAEVLEQLGFPCPSPIPVMKLPYQIAQKLHAVTTEGADRPHDLVDLQLMCGHSQIDLSETKAICIRLFDYRRRQPWPPTVAKGSAWDSLYEDAGIGLDVLPTCDEAVAWANDLIASINKA